MDVHGSAGPRQRFVAAFQLFTAVTESSPSQTQFLEECALRRPCFIAIAMRVEIERRLNSRMTQNALHGLGLDLRLVTSQLENPVPEIVKTETLERREMSVFSRQD
jgi:hypothetical protein